MTPLHQTRVRGRKEAERNGGTIVCLDVVVDNTKWQHSSKEHRRGNNNHNHHRYGLFVRLSVFQGCGYKEVRQGRGREGGREGNEGGTEGYLKDD